MKVTDNGYLDTQGFSVILYHGAYDRRVSWIRKTPAMEMIAPRPAHRDEWRRAAGSPRNRKQWHLVAQLKGRRPDKDHDRLNADLSFPDFSRSTTPWRSPRSRVAPGLSVNLAKPLPEKLAGRAGFNLEFLPSIYVGKSCSN